MILRYASRGLCRGGDHRDVGCTADDRVCYREAGRNLEDTADILRGDIRMMGLSEYRVRGMKDSQRSMVADMA